MFLNFEFRVDRSPNFGATGVKNRPFPLTRHIAYTTACSYRSSCDLTQTLNSYFKEHKENTVCTAQSVQLNGKSEVGPHEISEVFVSYWLIGLRRYENTINVQMQERQMSWW